jgi:hypothetical protein
MTPIESIYEIKEAVIDLQKCLNSRNRVVSIRSQMRCEQLVDRFFMENINVAEIERHNMCLHDPDYFFKLLETTAEYYDFR